MKTKLLWLIHSQHMSAEQCTDIVRRSYMTTTSGLKKSSSSPEQSTGAESAMGFERVSKFCVHY